jgi:hypothetical protein
MKAAARLALCIPLLAGPALAACAGGGAAAKQPEAHEAPPPPQGDGHTQLERTLEVLKQPGVKAEKDTHAAQSVVDAIRGAAQMQGDAGLRDHE